MINVTHRDMKRALALFSKFDDCFLFGSSQHIIISSEDINKLDPKCKKNTNLSLPGGSFVGHHNCAYVIYDGLFFRAVKSLLLKGFKIELYDRYPIYRPDAPILTYDNDGREIPITESCSRMRDLTEYRYICTNCEEELFCSSELKVKCGKCDEAFVLDNFQSLNTSFN